VEGVGSNPGPYPAGDSGLRHPVYPEPGSRSAWILPFAKMDFWPKRSGFGKLNLMKAQFTYWKERDGRYLGYINAYPDHWTQGESLEDLKEQLKDLYHTFSSEEIPGIF
jgi:hypothetical protein